MKISAVDQATAGEVEFPLTISVQDSRRNILKMRLQLSPDALSIRHRGRSTITCDTSGYLSCSRRSWLLSEWPLAPSQTRRERMLPCASAILESAAPS